MGSELGPDPRGRDTGVGIRVMARMFGDDKSGQRIGRYRVVERLGGGGMGVVYRAFDPKLRREVALKRLHSPAVHRIVDEARAMARLAHPNVVPVFDAEEETSGEGGFVVMELVPGTTLERWLADEPRGWREILAMFIGAGRGLAAAHAAGVLHRDFKPANVLIGLDGRPRVADFGIAAPLQPRCDHVTDTWKGAGDGSRSGPHGTRGYIAPERLGGQRATPASDQFSFCVSLSEALAEVPTPTPRRIDQIVERGVSEEPEDRWPTMDHLVDALAKRDQRKRTGVVVLVGGAAAVLAAGAARPSEQRCEAVEGIAMLEPDQQQTLAASFRRWPASVADRLSQGLDGYVSRWTAMRTEICEAATVDAPASPDLPNLECMQQARDALAAVADQLARTPEVSGADRLLSSLPDLDSCRGPRSDHAVPLPDDVLAVRASRKTLARARAMRLAGDLVGATAVHDTLTDELDGVDFPPLHTELALEQGLLAVAQGRYQEAQQHLSRTRNLAVGTSQWRELARATTAKMHTLLVDGAKAKEALLLADVARGLAQRVPREAYEVELVIAQSHFLLGGDEEAETGMQLALEHARAADDQRRIAKARGELARIYSYRGDHEAAVEEQRASLATYKRLEGDDTSNVAWTHSMLATTLMSQGELSSAEKHARRAVEIRRRINDPEDPKVAHARSLLGQVLSDLQRYEEATDHIQWAIERYDALGIPLMAARARWHLTEILQGQHRYASAAAVAEVALEDARTQTPGDATIHVVLRRSLGLAQWANGDDRAIDNLRAALAMAERIGAPGHLPATRVALARVLLDLGEPTEAAALTRAALEELEQTQWSPGWIAGIVATLGLALQEQGNLDEAEVEYRRALEAIPDSMLDAEDERAWCRVQLALVRAQRGHGVEDLKAQWELARRRSATKVRSAAAFALARALWTSEPERALRLGRSALEAHHAGDPLTPGKRAGIRAWLEQPKGL